MKILQSSIFRALCACIVGILLISNPGYVAKGITIAIGILFFTSGAISCFAYWNARRQGGETIVLDANGKKISGGTPTFPIVGIGSLLLGLILLFIPSTFIRSLMYVLGAMVILGAINQFMALISVNKFCKMSFGYWVLPIILLLTGIFIVVKPMETAETPFVIIGIALVVYGISECINSIAIHNEQKRYAQLTRYEDNATTITENTPQEVS